MDSYILRIYHRDIQGSHAVVGMLETPDGNARYVFRNVEELWKVLLMESAVEDEATYNSSRREDDPEAPPK